MIKVHNISDHSIGYQGVTVEPGGFTVVDAGTATAMVNSGPGKWSVEPQRLSVRAEAVEGSPPAAAVTRPAEAPERKHSHSYRKNETCACGRIRKAK